MVVATADAEVAEAGAPAAGTESTSGPRPSLRRHLWQVDVVRLLTFSAVISVHALAFTQQPGNRVAAGMMMLLQYGREVFFALTGFVLIYSAANRPLKLKPFWSKRILYVAVPYFTWSILYYLYAVLGPPHLHPSVSGFAWDLLYGGAEYHLYFLVVTLQLYVSFPLILRFVRRTAHRAGLVLGLVSIANLTWLGVLQYASYPTGWSQWFFTHAYELLPTYAMYVLAGCYAAVYLPKIEALVRRRSALLLRVSVVAAAGALAVYALQLPHQAPRIANSVLQPAMALSCVAAVIVTYIVGSRWAAGPRRHEAKIQLLSEVSFGVYLSHPLVLQFLLNHGLGDGRQVLPSPLATLLAFAAAAAGGTAISLVARRTPLSLALTGRPWQRSPAGDRVDPPSRRPFRLPPALAPRLALVPVRSDYPTVSRGGSAWR